MKGRFGMEMVKVKKLDHDYIKECFAFLDSLSETEALKVHSLWCFAIIYFQGYNQGRPVGINQNFIMAHNLECWEKALNQWEEANQTDFDEIANRMLPESEQSEFGKRLLANIAEECREHPINVKKLDSKTVDNNDGATKIEGDK
jgi:hypothetical protein